MFAQSVACVLVIALGVATAGCCVEGYPARRVSDVGFQDVPSRVRKAFTRAYRPDQVVRVEQSAFDSFCAGDDYRYRFHLDKGHTITFDQKGRLNFWREGIRQDDAAPETGG